MSTTTKNINVNIYKSRLRHVIENLQLLEDRQSDIGKTLLQPTKQQELEALMSKTSNLLEELEAAPIAKIFQKIQKRRRKRQNAKLRRKLHQATAKSVSSSTAKEVKLTKNSVVCKEESITLKKSNAVTQKPHQQLRSYYNSTRLLRTFELLELLHSVRSQDDESTREFSNKLSKLRTIWNVIHLENKPEHTTAQDIQHQWSTVLFGPQEKLYYKKTRNFNDLLNVRRKWDSFLCHNKKLGSSIPTGWVLPPENADERWQRYRCELQNSDSHVTE